MDTPPPMKRDLARRLLAASRFPPDTPPPHAHAAVVVSQRLRTSLTRFAGTDGFASLMRRALMLARVEAPTLHNVKVAADGTLDGFDSLATSEEVGSKKGLRVDDEAAVAILAHLLGLLVTFIGESLTLRLIHEAWPEIPLDDFKSKIEDAR
ncbi:MAG: hypothetical protein H7210_05695 [Pyrinomonadaceae bacterium]|nr:hypothetical protein [Phycisphaerales bacterium]